MRVSVNHSVHGTVNMKQHPILATPIGKAGVGAKTAGNVIVHDDGRANFFGVFRSSVHFLGCWRSDIQVVTLTLTSLGFSLKRCLLNEVEPLTPTHKRLAINVLVVLGKIEPAAQAFINGTTVILRRESKLGLDGAAQQRTAILIHDITLNLNAIRRPTTGLNVGYGKAHIFEA